jgi:hypothetical protein
MPSLINPYENQNSFTTAIYVENGLAKLVNGRPLKAVSHYWRLTAPRLEGRGFCTFWGFLSSFRAPHGCCIILQPPPSAPGRCGLIAC